MLVGVHLTLHLTLQLRCPPACVQGTIIRVFALPTGDKLFSFRRGTQSAAITSLSFYAEPGPPDTASDPHHHPLGTDGMAVSAPVFLVAASKTSTVHVYRMGDGSTVGSSSSSSSSSSSVGSGSGSGAGTGGGSASASPAIAVTTVSGTAGRIRASSGSGASASSVLAESPPDKPAGETLLLVQLGGAVRVHVAVDTVVISVDICVTGWLWWTCVSVVGAGECR